MSLCCSETGEILMYPFPFFVLHFFSGEEKCIFAISKDIVELIPIECRSAEGVTDWLTHLEVCEGESSQNFGPFADAWTWSGLRKGEFKFSVSFDDLEEVAPNVTTLIKSSRPSLQ